MYERYYSLFGIFFFFKQKTAYEMRISDWSSDVCSSDLQSLSRLAIAAGWELLLSFRQCAASGRCGAGLYNNRPGAPCGAGGPLGARPANSLSVCFEIGRASCRERVGQYVSISVVAVSLKKNTKHTYTQDEDSLQRGNYSRKSNTT